MQATLTAQRGGGRLAEVSQHINFELPMPRRLAEYPSDTATSAHPAERRKAQATLRSTRRVRTTHAPHATRVRLVEETARAIDQHGLDAVDVDEILASAGVTKGALYHHFESVNGLLVAALVSLYAGTVDENIKAFESILVDCHSVDEVRQRIASITRATQDPRRRSARLHRARVLSQTVAEPELARSIDTEQRRLTDALADTVAQAQARGWFRRDVDPRALAVFVQAYTLGRVIDDVTSDHVSQDAWTSLIDQVIDGFLMSDAD